MSWSLSSRARSVPMGMHFSGASLDSESLSVSSIACALGLIVVSLFASLVVGFFATSLMRLYRGMGLPSIHLEAVWSPCTVITPNGDDIFMHK